jgi:hypothetical protein
MKSSRLDSPRRSQFRSLAPSAIEAVAATSVNRVGKFGNGVL